jgi:peptidoglycan pentaglycine glycine transferase (the first glycine)
MVSFGKKMFVSLLASDRKDEWNAFVMKEPYFALLQSWEWGEFKKKMGWKVFRIAAIDNGFIIAGAQMLVKSLPFGFVSMAYIPRGPVGNWLDNKVSSPLFSEFHRIARLNKAAFLRIEPPLLNSMEIDLQLRRLSFRPSPFTNQPRATIILNLDWGLDDILQQMRKRTREYIKYSFRQGVNVRCGNRDDISKFYDIMRITHRRGKFALRFRDYYEQEWETFAKIKQASFFMAVYQDRLLATHMSYGFGEHAAYFHGGSLNDYSELRPNYLLIWEAIKWAKSRGCRTYDLWGIPDEVGRVVAEGKKPPVSERTDGLWGLYRFKSGFCKNVVYYLGAYDYVYYPLLYPMITLKLFNLNSIERVMAHLDWIKHS